MFQRLDTTTKFMVVVTSLFNLISSFPDMFYHVWTTVLFIVMVPTTLFNNCSSWPAHNGLSLSIGKINSCAFLHDNQFIATLYVDFLKAPAFPSPLAFLPARITRRTWSMSTLYVVQHVAVTNVALNVASADTIHRHTNRFLQTHESIFYATISR